IAATPSIRGELAIGWGFHYEVGIVYAALYLAISFDTDRLQSKSTAQHIPRISSHHAARAHYPRHLSNALSRIGDKENHQCQSRRPSGFDTVAALTLKVRPGTTESV